MTTQDFLYKVQFRGRMESLREAQQGTELIFSLLKRYFSSDPYHMLGHLSEDIRGLWWSDSLADKKDVDWYHDLEQEIKKLQLSTTAHDLTAAVLRTLKEAVGMPFMRSLSLTLPDDVREYSF